MSAPNTTNKRPPRSRPARRRRRALSLGRLLLAAIGAAGILFAVFQLLRPEPGGEGTAALFSSAVSTDMPAVSPEPTSGLPDVDVNSWELRLVDLDHPLGADFVPPELELVADNERMDSRVAPAMAQLFTDAQAAGYTIYFCSGYREYASQYDLYWDHVDTYEGQGMTQAEAETKTLISVQYPGCSEHQSGLCGDVLESRDQPMEPYIGGSGLMLWLEQHCADYGFVVRYPEGKTDITGIYYEPWHLRYVGKEAARYMMENDLCLEEFLALYEDQSQTGADQSVSGAAPADADAAVVNTFSAVPKLASSAKCVLIVDRDSGRALYERNTQDQIYPASTTKMMTALCAAEATEDLDQELVTVRQDVLDQLPDDDNSLAGLEAGEEMTMRQLLYALMLPSGNDAALVIADHVAGSVEAFAGRMNQRAAELGCTGTYFVNPHGLAQTEQYSTAWDLARIAEAYLQVPALAEIAATHEFAFSTNEREVELQNSNLLLDPDSELYMPEACGIKTGIISLGASFVSAAEKDGLRVLCVTLEVPATYDDGRLITPNPALAEGRKYLEWACDSFQRVSLCDGAQVMTVTVPGTEDTVEASAGQTVTAVVPAEQAQQLTMTVEPADGLTKRPAGGEVVGYIRWTCGDEAVTDDIPLYALAGQNGIPLWMWVAACALLALSALLAVLARSRSRRRRRRRSPAARRRTAGQPGRRG